MSVFAFVRAAGLLCAACCLAAEAPNRPVDPVKGFWLRVASANFEVYTTAGEDAGRNLVRRFERLRTVLLPAFKFSPSQDKPVCVIAFQSGDEFQPYTPVEGASGFFLAGGHRDFVVLGSASTETRTAAHEYGHVVISQSGLRLPAWLTEGLAELYSNVNSEPSDAPVLVGEFIRGRVLSLRRDGWIDLRDLVTAGPRSSVFASPALVESAYAESWLLVHMLAMDPRYTAGFSNLLTTIQTTNTAEAFDAVYGKSLTQVERDLRGYLDAGQANARLLASQPAAGDAPIAVDREADFSARLALAEMLGNYGGRNEQAREAYRQMARDYPLRPEVEDGMAELYRGEGDRAQASLHRARASVLQMPMTRAYGSIEPSPAALTQRR